VQWSVLFCCSRKHAIGEGPDPAPRGKGNFRGNISQCSYNLLLLDHINTMRAIATDVASSVVCVCVCLSAGHELCQNSCTECSAVWGQTHVYVTGWRSRLAPPGKWNVAICAWPHCGLSLLLLQQRVVIISSLLREIHWSFLHTRPSVSLVQQF